MKVTWDQDKICQILVAKFAERTKTNSINIELWSEGGRLFATLTTLEPLDGESSEELS